ncbi:MULTISPECIES: DUF2630 family protein [unclassified Streptomyces]|uniref:DUF2630 family protein n=1 Tax=unclassified Streptomyces TaxID=2593676 RepID=UPI003321CF7C
MDDRDIFEHVDELVSEERDLRDRSVAKMGLTTDEKARLRAVEVQLDQCWDLLRRRRALSEYGEDPSTAKVRPADEVEGYQN